MRGTSIVALAAFAGAALALLASVTGHLTTALAGDGADASLFVWNDWHLARALAHGEDPFHTTETYWPTGASLVLHTLSPLNAAVAALLQPALGLVGAYNVLLLASFALSAWAAYLLAKELGAQEPGAYFAGFAFGFASYHYAHALGHLNLVHAEWLPATLLFVEKHRASGRGAHVAGAALCLLAAAFTDLSLLLTTILAVAALLVARGALRERRTWRLAAWCGAALAPIGAVVVFAYARSASLGSFASEAPRYSLDVFSYVVPTPFSTLYSGLGRVLPPEGTTTEATVFVGFLVLALAIFAIAKLGRAARPWLAIAAIFFVLSLGPRLIVAGRATPIPLPYAILERVPLLSALRTPARFGLVVILSAALVAGLGLDRALERRTHRRTLAAIACAIVLIETIVVPFPVSAIETPPVYGELSKYPTEALVELPLAQPGYEGQLDRVHDLLAQTRHGLPIVNGYVSRETVRELQFMRGELVLSALSRLEVGGVAPGSPDVVSDESPTALAGDLLSAAGLRTMILHRHAPPTDTERREEAFLAGLSGVARVYDSPSAAIYVARAAVDPPLLVDLVGGWHGLEMDGTTPTRWTFEDPTLAVHARAAFNGTLHVHLQPYHRARHLDVVVDGARVATRDVPLGWSDVDVPLALAAGAHRVCLCSQEPAQSPRSAFAGDDDRPLAFAVQDVRLVSST